ncbi:MAG: CBS domain-containing protein [Anaerolineae bacterium]|jgi:Zn-dependent protease|nr:CBS domain-containing protein [Chloroflexota bacterium]
MLGYHISLGRLSGVPVRLDVTWFLLAGGLVWALPRLFLQSLLPDASLALLRAAAVVIALLFGLVVLIHELAHALAARARHLNPLHITLSLAGGGLSLAEDHASPLDQLSIALAGPLSTLIMGAVFAGFWRVLEPFAPVMGAIARTMALVCLTLGGLNLLPALPLDGGKALSAGFWALGVDPLSADRWAGLFGRWAGLLMTLFGILMWFNTGVREWVWVAVIGILVEGGAHTALRRQGVLRALQGRTAADVMVRGCVPLPSSLTLDQLDSALAQRSVPCLLVGDERGLAGLLRVSRLRRVRPEAWPATTLQEVMLPLDDQLQVPPELPLARVLHRLTELGLDEIPVMRDGALLGVVTRQAVHRLIETSLAMGLHD